MSNIEVIGEAAKNVERADPVFAAEHPEIPLPVIYAMRNRISHGYFEVDLDVVWQTVQADLSALEQQIRGLMHIQEPPSGDVERTAGGAGERRDSNLDRRSD